MKRITIIILILFSGIISAQVKAPGTDFILQNKVVFWQHTYTLEGKTADEIAVMIKEKMASVTSDTVVATQKQQFAFPVKNDKADIRKYGGKPFKTVTFAQLYMDYSPVIDVEDNKYKVTIREILLSNNDATEKKAGRLDKFVCNTSNISFKTEEGVQKGLTYLNSHLTDKFDVTIPAVEKKK